MAAKKNVKTLNLAAVLDLNEATVLRDKLLSLRGKPYRSTHLRSSVSERLARRS
jgi:hypothetical protein